MMTVRVDIITRTLLLKLLMLKIHWFDLLWFLEITSTTNP